MLSRVSQDKRSRFTARKLRDQAKKNRPAVAAIPANSVSPPLLSPGLPFAEALKGLLTLTEMMRSMRAPDGTHGAVEPMIVLSSAGIEMRMAAAEPVVGTPQHPVAKSEAPSPDWLARIEKSLDDVRQSNAKLQESVTRDVRNLQETLQTQAEYIESVRAALAQNEQLVESIVESLSAGDGVDAGALGTLADLGDLSPDESAEAPLSF